MPVIEWVCRKYGFVLSLYQQQGWAWDSSWRVTFSKHLWVQLLSPTAPVWTERSAVFPQWTNLISIWVMLLWDGRHEASLNGRHLSFSYSKWDLNRHLDYVLQESSGMTSDSDSPAPSLCQKVWIFTMHSQWKAVDDFKRKVVKTREALTIKKSALPIML